MSNFIHLDAGDPQTPREALLYTTIARLKYEIEFLRKALDRALCPISEERGSAPQEPPR